MMAPFDAPDGTASFDAQEAWAGLLPKRRNASQACGRAENAAAWQSGLKRSDKGIALSILANAAHALRHAPELSGLLKFDRMANCILMTRPAPDSKLAFTGQRPVGDADVSAIQEWLQKYGLCRLARDVVDQAVGLIARENGFHPVRDYLDGLQWDGKRRLDSWLACYLGAELTEYTAAIGRMFLIAMIARVMKPGCKADYMLVLEGEQGAGKSTACAILGERWFSDQLPDLQHGDAVRLSTHLRGKWLIEIAELSSFNKAEAGALKAFLTQTEERYIPKYGRNEVFEPRQCVFVGTTNKRAYLRDETGARRFWPLKIGTIDLGALRADRDQLFGEAVAACRRGDRWWPDSAFEREHIAPEQEARFEADPWEDKALTFLADSSRTTVAEVAEWLGLAAFRQGTAEARRITNIFERAGWEQKRNMNGRWWEPAPAGQPCRGMTP